MLFLISSCAMKYWTIEGPFELSNGLRVSIKTTAWSYYPSDLDRYVLPIYLEVENKGNEPVNIERYEVYLLDEKGNQFNLLEPKDVASLLRRSHSIGFSFGIGYWSSPIGIWWWPYYALPPREEAYPDILNKAFIFGQIQPKARLSGFVYFPRVPKGTKGLILYVKGYSFSLKMRED
ncbi:MAG: hypothetical protein ACK4OF_06790 [Aquificaceae bacterium]